MEQTQSSPSASPEAIDDDFIGIDPDDTREVVMKGATFTVGVLPSGLWDIVSTQSTISFQDARRRAIAKLSSEGQSPEEIKDGMMACDREAVLDPMFIKSQFKIRMEALKFGLRGHVGFKTKNSAVPFELEDFDFDGVNVKVVSEKTLRVYRVNPRIVTALWMSLMKVNELSDLAKKV